MPAKPENKKCPNCGACQECGHGGTQYVPYPVYPPVNPWPRPWVSPYIGTSRPPQWIASSGSGLSAFGNHTIQ